jgi:triphosphoribosyl-dephospho-CoA synthetase
VGKRLTATQKESAQGVVEAVRAEQAHAKKKKRRKKRKQVSPSAPTDPFDQCSFTTMEGLKVSWKYGNIAQERVSTYLKCWEFDIVQYSILSCCSVCLNYFKKDYLRRFAQKPFIMAVS